MSHYVWTTRLCFVNHRFLIRLLCSNTSTLQLSPLETAVKIFFIKYNILGNGQNSSQDNSMVAVQEQMAATFRARLSSIKGARTPPPRMKFHVPYCPPFSKGKD